MPGITVILANKANRVGTPGNAFGVQFYRWCLAAAIALTAMPAWSGLAEGMAAYDKKHYQAALSHLRAPALQGDAAAQTRIGLIHANGLGVPVIHLKL